MRPLPNVRKILDTAAHFYLLPAFGIWYIIISTNERSLLMPLYEYKCEKCGEVFEQLVMSSRKEDMHCPKCGHTHVRKLMSQTATIGQNKSLGSCGTGNSSGFS